MAPVRRNVISLPAETVTASTAQGRKLSRRPSKAVAAERKAHAMKLHVETASRAQIAAELGMSAATVKTWMLDKAAFAPHPPAPASATESSPVDPIIELAATLRAQGKTYGEIVKATGLTRGRLSWIMKSDRVRFPIKDRSAATRAAAARRRSGMDDLPAAADEAPAPVDETPIAVDAAPVSAPIAADPVDAAPLSVADSDMGPVDAADDRPSGDDAFRPLPGFEPVALVDAVSATCRWPVYPAGRSRFGVAVHCCGRATGDLKRSYCDTHARMSRGAGSSAERAVYRVAARPLVPAGAATTSFPSQLTGA